MDPPLFCINDSKLACHIYCHESSMNQLIYLLLSELKEEVIDVCHYNRIIVCLVMDLQRIN